MSDSVKSVLLLTILFQSSECTMESFVVGGENSNIKDYPHSVFLESICKTNWTCGAAILNQRILITAAHCLFECELKHKHRMDASAGSAALSNVKIKRVVKQILVHRMYMERLVMNDIGLALLDKDIPLGRYTKRVIVQKSFPREVYGQVAGWGITDEDTGAFSINLKNIRQKLRSKRTCVKVGELSPGMFCAGSEQFYEDHPSEGDSGSALITSNFIAIGLVSFRIAAYPALLVYTNITYYYPWLSKKAKQLYCNGR